MDPRNFLCVLWHNGREMTVIEGPHNFQIRMEKIHEEEKKMIISKELFQELTMMDWTKIVFWQLAFSQTPSESIYKVPQIEDEGLKCDSRFSSTLSIGKVKLLIELDRKPKICNSGKQINREFFNYLNFCFCI